MTYNDIRNTLNSAKERTIPIRQMLHKKLSCMGDFKKRI